MKLKDKVIIVTGASSGLGRDIAKLLCQKGATIYSIARSKDKLIELQKECSKYSGKIEISAGDLTNREFREELISTVLKKYEKVDYLINNAGYGKLEELENIEYHDLEGIVNLNFIALMHLCQLVIPEMKKRKSGRIINISSIAALQPPPFFAVYNATKYAVYGFTKSLSYDLFKTGVSVSVVFPPRMDTPFWIRAFKCKNLTGNEQKRCISEWTEKALGPLPIAKYIVRKLNTKKLILLPTILPKITYYILRHFYFIGNLLMKNLRVPKIKKILKKDGENGQKL